LDAVTGAKVWNFTTGGHVQSAPALADGKVYAGSWNHKVYCLDAATGAFIWSYTGGAHFVSSPAVANGVVYIGSIDRKVYAFSAVPPVPEGLTIGAMLLLSTVAVTIGARYFRKRSK
jgi:outer membrane protein assembly factor BamB